MRSGQGRYSRCPCGTGNPPSVRLVVIESTAVRRTHMSDYRDPNDPLYGNTWYQPPSRTSTWGWIAGGAAALVIVLGLIFAAGHEPTRVASNNATPPQTTAPAAPNTMPGLTPPTQAPRQQ